MAKKSRNEKRKLKHLKIRKNMFGTSSKPRLVVFKSLKHFEAQLIDDENKKTLVYVSTKQLNLKNGSNKEAAAQVGSRMGDKIKELGIELIIFDRSGYIYHGKVLSCAEAIREKGVKF